MVFYFPSMAQMYVSFLHRSLCVNTRFCNAALYHSRTPSSSHLSQNHSLQSWGLSTRMLNRMIQTTLLSSGTLIRMGTLRCVLVRQMMDRRSSNLSQRTQKLSRGVGKFITHYDVAFVDGKYDMASQYMGKFGTVYDAVRNKVYTYRYLTYFERL